MSHSRRVLAWHSSPHQFVVKSITFRWCCKCLNSTIQRRPNQRLCQCLEHKLNKNESKQRNWKWKFYCFRMVTSVVALLVAIKGLATCFLLKLLLHHVLPSSPALRHFALRFIFFRKRFRPEVCGFFFNSWILFAHHLFGFFTQDLQTNRTLTLISKTIQSLGNLVSSRSAQQHAKEEFTVELYKKFCTEKHVDAVKKFLDAISTEDSNDSREVELCGGSEPILLKDG